MEEIEAKDAYLFSEKSDVPKREKEETKVKMKSLLCI
jgi:hypothetical protein